MPIYTCQRLTLVIAKERLAAIGWVINRIGATGEYRIYPKGYFYLDYFTESLLDAYQTATYRHARSVAVEHTALGYDDLLLPEVSVMTVRTLPTFETHSYSTPRITASVRLAHAVRQALLDKYRCERIAYISHPVIDIILGALDESYDIEEGSNVYALADQTYIALFFSGALLNFQPLTSTWKGVL